MITQKIVNGMRILDRTNAFAKILLTFHQKELHI